MPTTTTAKFAPLDSAATPAQRRGSIFGSNGSNVGLVYLFANSLIAASAHAAEPIRLHAENPHDFLFREKPTVLVTSTEHYSAVLNLDFDFISNLDELKSHGLNLTRTFSGVYCELPGNFKIKSPPYEHDIALAIRRTDI